MSKGLAQQAALSGSYALDDISLQRRAIDADQQHSPSLRAANWRCQGGSVLLAPQTPHRAGGHVEVAGDGSGRFTSCQPPPCLGLLALGEGRLTPEIGPTFEWPLQAQKARLEHDLVWRAAKLSCDAPHGKSGLAIVAAHDAHFPFGPKWGGQGAHIKPLLLQDSTQGLYVETYALGHVRQRHPAVDQLARDPHLLRVWRPKVNPCPLAIEYIEETSRR